ncbi:MAG: BON domain-containing protein [Gammaproteobacteria bacterium]|nr:MAG: BON domain-containing protein [Gammaproteobacteria bacterium]
MQKLLMVSLMSATLMLSGCAGLLVGGAVVGTAAAVSTLHDRRTPGTVVDDRNLELVISKKILGNQFINTHSHSNLTIYNGVVLVTGEAANAKVKNDIINLVRSTANVKAVREDIAIMPNSSLLSRSNDSAITTKVKTALLSLDLPNFDPTLLNVSTERGKVYLMGLVTRLEAEAIIDRVRRVRGVLSVTDVFEYIQ